MAKHVNRIAQNLGAKVVERLPDVCGGAMAAMLEAAVKSGAVEPDET